MFYVPPEPCEHINPPRFLFIHSNSSYNTTILWPWCLFWSKSTFWRPLFSDVYIDTPISLSKPPLYFPGKGNPHPFLFPNNTIAQNNAWPRSTKLLFFESQLLRLKKKKKKNPLFLYTLFLLPITPFKLMLYPSWTVTPSICFASLHWWFSHSITQITTPFFPPPTFYPPK